MDFAGAEEQWEMKKQAPPTTSLHRSALESSVPFAAVVVSPSIFLPRNVVGHISKINLSSRAIKILNSSAIT